MIKPLLFALTTTSLALSACGQSPAEKQGEAQATAAAQANGMAAAVEMPPSIQSTVTFRCQPNDTLQKVYFYAGDKQVGLAQEGSPTITMLSRTEEQGPYTAAPTTTAGGGTAGAAGAAPAMPEAAGVTFTGDQTNAIITDPAQPTRRCKASPARPPEHPAGRADLGAPRPPG